MTAIYAATTMATLQSLTGPFAAGDAAEVDGYAGMGDAAGGTFCFEGTAPSSATITNVTVSTKTITDATNASPIVITATAHGFTTGQSVLVSGVLGNTAAIGAWLITVCLMRDLLVAVRARVSGVGDQRRAPAPNNRLG